jgi:hypothetical protein
MAQNRLALNASEYVRKACADCSDDEVALDALAQWASNPVGKHEGYGIEENYPVIRENLSSRFNVSDSIASEYVSRLREYGTQFLLSGADIGYVRQRIMEELAGESGKQWKQGMVRKLSKASPDTKRLAYLIFSLLRRGFDAKNFEGSMDKVQAFHAAVFERPFSIDREDDLIDVGILNNLLFTTDETNKQYVHMINPLFPVESLGITKDDLKILTDSKGYVRQLYEKKKLEQLQLLDDISREDFGLKKFDNPPKGFVQEKKITATYKEYAAISPFLLEEIRNGIHSIRHERLAEYETRIEAAIMRTIRDSSPKCRVDLISLEREQALWRLDEATNPKLYIYVAPWLTEADISSLVKTMEVPNGASVIAIVLSQSSELAGAILRDSLSSSPELSLITPVSQKEAKSQTIIGTPGSFASTFVESLTSALDLSAPMQFVTRRDAGKDHEIPAVVDQFDDNTYHPKILLGGYEKREIHWIPFKEQNWNVAVFGDPQTGKTQTVKRVVLELATLGIPTLVLDANGDYLPKDPSTSEFGTVVQPGEISLNPLELRNGNSPREQRYEILASLGVVCGLEEMETYYVGHAIERVYEKFGIYEDDKNTWSKIPPTLEDVRAHLEYMAENGKGHDKDSIKSIFQKLGPVLEHPLYSQAKTNLPFDKLVSGSMIINLHGVQNPLLKIVTTEFLLLRMPSFAEKGSVDPKVFIALDGIPRLMVKNSSSLRLLREARGKGMGVIYSCEHPANLPEMAFNNFATQVSFRTTDSKNAKALADHLGVKDAGTFNKPLADKFSAVARFSSEPTLLHLSILPHFKGSVQTSVA